MKFNAQDYIEDKNSKLLLNGIKKFICDHKDIYGYTNEASISDKEILSFMIFNSKAKNIHTASMDCASYIKNLRNLAAGKNSRRQTIIFLIYALNIDEFPETAEGATKLDTANKLLQDYLHQPILSAHNLTEFIIMAGLHSDINASDIFEIIDEYSEKINNAPVSSPKLYIGQTGEIEDALFSSNSAIKTKEDLVSFLDDSKNSVCFVKIRNTQYLALFDEYTSGEIWIQYKNNNSKEAADYAESYIDEILKYAYSGDGDSVDDVNDIISKTERRKLTEMEKTIISYWINFYNISDINLSEEKARAAKFTREELKILSKVFPTAFLSYETYLSLIKRNRDEEIPAELYMIMLLKHSEAINNEDYMYEAESEGIDFANSFIEDINRELKLAGFPTVNAYNNFCKLVIDTYEYIKKSHKKSSSEEIKTLLLDKLRSRLVKIIKEYSRINAKKAK